VRSKLPLVEVEYLLVELGRDRAIASAPACQTTNKSFNIRHYVFVAWRRRSILSAERYARCIHARGAWDFECIAGIDYHSHLAVINILQLQLVYLHDHIPINLFFLCDFIQIVSRLHDIHTPVLVAGR
jgi:hypothetical protein